MNAPPGARSLRDMPSLENSGRPPHGLRRILPLKIADAYLFEFTLESTLRGVMWFAGLLAAFAIITAMRKLVDNTVTGWGLVQIFALSLPRLILFTLPMSLLYGCVQTFTDLSSRGEATALGVGGMSLPRMMRAPLMFGVVLTIIAFGMQELAVPRAEQARLDVLQQQVLQATGVQSPFDFSKKSDNGAITKIHAKSLNFKTRTLINPVVQVYYPDGTLNTQIQAPRAIWSVQDGTWVFYKVFTRKLQLAKFGVESEGDNQTPYIEGHHDMWHVNYVPDPNQLNNGAKNLQQNLESKNYEMVSIAELAAYRAQVQARLVSDDGDPAQREARVRSTTYGIHDKIATPLICLALVLVGCPLGVHPPRSQSNGQAMGMGLSLMVILVYYVVWTWMSGLGKAGIGMPLLLAYLPLLMTLVAGLILLRKKAL